MNPAIYVGTIRHRRFTPVPHAFRYPLFMVALDVERIDELMAVSPFTSRNRFNWASFHDRDHFGDPERPLRQRVIDDARRAGVDLPDGPIVLLTHLRYLGYCFNPVSFFYCYDARGRLQRVLCEVNNTFGGSHNYWSRPRDHMAKRLHVSPFMGADIEYRFAFTDPGVRLLAHMTCVEHGAATFDATLSLTRRPWSSSEIHRALRRHPMMTARVIAAIHWQALKLWWKGVPYIDHAEPNRPIAVSQRPQ